MRIDCGLVVPPETPDRLADAIRSLSRDRELRVQMGERGRQKIEKSCDRAHITRDLEAALQTLLEQPGARNGRPTQPEASGAA